MPLPRAALAARLHTRSQVFGFVSSYCWGNHAQEGPEFLRQGGAIRLFLPDDHVRFEISLDATEQARLKISSKLLALAQNVRGGRAGGG